MLEQLASEVSPLAFSLLIKYKYLVLFPILVVEGPIITVLSGALATPEAHVFHIVPLFFFVVFADLCGDTFYYLLGYFAGEKVLERISKKKKVDYNTKITNYFNRYGGRTLMIAKISHGLGWPVMVFAGSARMKYSQFLTYNFFISLIKTALLLGIGYLYAEKYKTFVEYFGSTSKVVSLTIVLLLGIYFLAYKRGTNNK
jgi:membrane protein DedA with SNARE-associated domain